MPIPMLPYSFGPWSEPACICTFGASGSGKSTDAACAFPDAYTFQMPGGIKSVQTFFGPQVYALMQERVVTVESLDQVLSVIVAMGQGKVERRPIIVDDGSLQAGALHDKLRPQYDHKHNFQFWAKIKEYVRAFRTASRYAGVHVVINSHPIDGAPKWVVDERSQEREFVPAGPMLAGKSITPEITFAFDVVYEVRRSQRRADLGLWPAEYWCEDNSETHRVKDRHGIAHGPVPMNLREIMVAANYGMPRIPGFEWFDDVIAKFIEKMKAGAELGPTFIMFRDQLRKNQIPAHTIGWVLRDAMDRWELMNRDTWIDRAFAPKPTVNPAEANPLAALAGAAPAAATGLVASPQATNKQ